ncbi:MAG TPA: hypothetical protein DCE41_15510 [Cytophagales bacterium]|nr:hypothetical protein [Cytophagales bacterium]HAA17655.1 hypothetical protein [Cytophagales bacterium]HAP63169.1 hypothetical protein [Cytophagales bacterium]
MASDSPTPQDHHWFDRLDASYAKGYSEKEKAAAIGFFREKEILPTYLLRPEEAFDLSRFPKSMWVNHLKVLEKWLPTEVVVQEWFLRFIDDANWPGYTYAWEQLVNLGSPLLPLLKTTIRKAHDNPHRKECLLELQKEILKGGLPT